MKYRYTVIRYDNDPLNTPRWKVYDKVKKWLVCEAYSKREAYKISKLLNKDFHNELSNK